MKVIHLPMEIAGQVGTMCKFLKQKNIDAIGYNYFDSFFKYDGVMQTESYELIKLLEQFIFHYDIFHFHNGHSVFENLADLQLIKNAGKKIIMHHRGNDVRFRTLAKEGPGYKNPYVYAEGSRDDDFIHESLTYFSKIVDCAIVQDYELYQYVISYYEKENKPVYILPRLIDLSNIQPKPKKKNNKKLTVIHAPTQQDFKGTKYIEKAVNALQQKYDFTYQRIEGLSRQEALERYKDADIIIDQILCGSYGNLSVEGMAYGKPVICYIREDLIKKYPTELPIISANPDTIYEALQQLITKPSMREELGVAGRFYVEKYHEASLVTNKLISIYETTLEQK